MHSPVRSSLVILALGMAAVLVACQEAPAPTSASPTSAAGTMATPVSKPEGGANADLGCGAEFYAALEQRVDTSDGRGHGPDIGSDEWQSVSEHQVGIRGNPNLPARGTAEWCDFVDQAARQRGM